MNKTKIGIFLSLMLVLGFCSSCKEQKSNNKLLLNEVLVNEGKEVYEGSLDLVQEKEKFFRIVLV